MFNPTYSVGNQRRAHGIGALADCGQFASGVHSGLYVVGSIDPQSGDRQPLAQRTPGGFVPSHGQGGASFGLSAVPEGAQGLAFYDVVGGGFHYARIERDRDGAMTGVSQTDANSYGTAENGSGTFTMSKISDFANFKMVRGVQSVKRMQSVRQFVEYC